MKRFAVLLIVMGLLLTIVPGVAADGPAGTWVSGITCQNLGGGEATIQLTFYQQGQGTAALSYEDPTPIAVGGSRNYYTPNTPPGVPSPFLGSVVVASDQPLACNVNTQTSGAGTTTDPYRIGTSSGFSSDATASKLYVPQVEKNYSGWSSYIAVQNAESDSVDVTVTYTDRYGNAVPLATEKATIPGGSNKVFYQENNASLSAPFLGAAVVSSDDGTSKLAVVTNFYNDGSESGKAQLHSYNGLSSGAEKLFAPRLVRNYYGYNSGLTIQNIGGSATSVSVDFSFGGAVYNYSSPTIQPNASLALYLPNLSELAPVDSLAMSSRFGSATVTAAAGGSIVAIVNEDNRGGAGIPVERVGQGSTYCAIPDGAQTVNVFFSQVPNHAGNIFSGGIQVANATSTPGTCNISWSGVSAASESNVPLPANGVISRYAPNVANLTSGFNGGVSVECTQPVIGISNLAAEPGSGRYGDSFTMNNGVNQ